MVHSLRPVRGAGCVWNFRRGVSRRWRVAWRCTMALTAPPLATLRCPPSRLPGELLRGLSQRHYSERTVSGERRRGIGQAAIPPCCLFLSGRHPALLSFFFRPPPRLAVFFCQAATPLCCISLSGRHPALLSFLFAGFAVKGVEKLHKGVGAAGRDGCLAQPLPLPPHTHTKMVVPLPLSHPLTDVWLPKAAGALLRLPTSSCPLRIA